MIPELLADDGDVFQSPDGDFVYSDPGLGNLRRSPGASFNPLTGISSILTCGGPRSEGASGESFNPLTGISSILTPALAEAAVPESTRFNPLTGISSILTGST